MDKPLEDVFNYATRELADELTQHHPDHQRIRLFLEQDADVKAALQLAGQEPTAIRRKNPALGTLLNPYIGAGGR